MNNILWPVLFRMAPIGVNNALEAIHTEYFCSDACRMAFECGLDENAPYERSGDYTTVDDVQCSQCGKTLDDGN